MLRTPMLHLRSPVSMLVHPAFPALLGSLVAMLAGMLVWTSGCGAGSSGPAETLDAYRAALDRNDFSAAYDLMSDRFRSAHSREEFIRMMNESPEEVADTVAQLGRARQQVEIAAELRYGQGEQLRLIHQDDQWRIASNPIQFYSQATPRDALRSFLRAYRLERWEIMLRFVPSRYRERMSVDELRQQFQGEQRTEIESKMKTLEAHLDEPIVEKGNEARMVYGERGAEASFIQEDGAWKVLDID